jgi:hypothetical protein
MYDRVVSFSRWLTKILIIIIIIWKGRMFGRSQWKNGASSQKWLLHTVMGGTQKHNKVRDTL